ncbi:MAG TPA: hypothetical protein VE959_30695 [Bryobacteraceae bacterium]|nr:hypothetical protein [Bryobacteraceae bacterium]
MRNLRWLGLLLACTPVGGQTVASPQAILTRVIETTRAYDSRLPDFVCTQLTRRSSDKSGTGSHWKEQDSYEDEVTYFGRRESYRLVKFNGKPTTRSHQQIRGYRSEGLFGALTSWVFRPEAQAEFTFDRQDTLRGRSLYVYRYRVAREHSRWASSVNNKTVVQAFHGLVWADVETTAVMRIQAQPDSDAGDETWQKNTQVDIQYSSVVISGQPYLLPVMAESRTFNRTLYLRNVTEFSGFHKYAAETSVEFGK